MPVKKNISLSELMDTLLERRLFICEEDDPYFKERLLQIIWNEQLLDQNKLTTECGKTVTVIHQGIWNLESGPDFHNASIFLDTAPVHGSVEIHMETEDWLRQGHQHDINNKDVILHVVWDNSRNHLEFPDGIPLLCLKNKLSISLKELIQQDHIHHYPYAEMVKHLSEASNLSVLSDPQFINLLESFGVSRMMQKAHIIADKILHDGADQTAYSLIAEALGYKNNRQAFKELSRIVTLERLKNTDSEKAMAILFGASGLLPDPAMEKIDKNYLPLLKTLWRLWWPERECYHSISWNRKNLRPFNCPERRLMALHLLLERCDYQPGITIINKLHLESNVKQAIKSLNDLFDLDDQQWQCFYNFKNNSRESAKLLGRSRMQDIVCNICIPFYLAWSMLNGDAAACLEAKKLLLSLPKGQNNRLLKEAVHSLIIPPSRSKDILINACTQQGLIQLYLELHPGFLLK